MNDLTRYEKELADQSKNLPLPDKKAAWQKLKQRLDEDDDKGVIILPPPSGDNGIGLLLLVITIIIGTAVFVLKSTTKQVITENKIITISKTNETIVNKNFHSAGKQKIQSSSTIGMDILNTPVANKTSTNNRQSVISDKIRGELTIHNERTKKENNKKFTAIKINGHTKYQFKSKVINADFLEVKDDVQAKRNLRLNRKGKIKTKITNVRATDEEQIVFSDNEQNAVSVPIIDYNLNIATNSNIVTPSIDSSLLVKEETIAKSPLMQKADSSIMIPKKKDKEKKYPLWSIGASIEQGVRVPCNCIYPADNNKRTTSISDYIPGIFVRYYPSNKWFIQSELRYGAPEFIRQFMYKSELENKPYNVIATSYVLQEAYYHQFHLSLNYVVTPKWVLGFGATYNLFSSAASQKDARKKPYGLPDSLVSYTIINHADNLEGVQFFNYWQTFIETEYKWRHFSGGAHYGIGLQSYVQYIDPFYGASTQRKNNSLNLFIRYEFIKPEKVTK